METDVVLGRNNMVEYSKNEGYFGAIIGRNSNRIANAQMSLGNTIYGLARNDNNNNLHGGDEGFDKKVWEATEIDGVEPELILKYVSPDGEEGFPGEVYPALFDADCRFIKADTFRELDMNANMVMTIADSTYIGALNSLKLLYWNEMQPVADFDEIIRPAAAAE